MEASNPKSAPLNPTWTPKVCRIIAFLWVLGHYFAYFGGLGKPYKPDIFTVEARKLEHEYPHALKVKCRGTPAEIILAPCSNLLGVTIAAQRWSCERHCANSTSPNGLRNLIQAIYGPEQFGILSPSGPPQCQYTVLYYLGVHLVGS